MKYFRVLISVIIGLVLALGLCIAAIGSPIAAKAAPNYWLAINTGAYFQVSASPLTTATATSTIVSDLPQLSIDSAGYADAGIVLFFDGSFTLGDLNTINITGTGNFAANLWFDTSGNNQFFLFDVSGVLQDLDGDIYDTVGNSSSGELTIDDTSSYNSYTLAELKAGDMTGVDSTTVVAVWIGISGSTPQTIYLTEVVVNEIPVIQPQGGGCFIATAAYGTPMAEQLDILRDFRDQYLLTNPAGEALVELYYNTSPPVADFIARHPVLKQAVRTGLEPAVAMSSVVVNTTTTQKIAILSSIVLFSTLSTVLLIRKKADRTRGNAS